MQNLLKPDESNGRGKTVDALGVVGRQWVLCKVVAYFLAMVRPACHFAVEPQTKRPSKGAGKRIPLLHALFAAPTVWVHDQAALTKRFAAEIGHSRA
jgi:hypothetical protein